LTAPPLYILARHRYCSLALELDSQRLELNIAADKFEVMSDEPRQDTSENQSESNVADKQQQLDQRLQKMEDYFEQELQSIKQRQKEMENEIEVEGLELVNKQLKEINTRLNRLSDIITNNRKRIRQLKDLKNEDEVLE